MALCHVKLGQFVDRRFAATLVHSLRAPTKMSFIKRALPSRLSLKLLYGLAVAHLGAMSYLTYQRNVEGNPMAFTWSKEDGVRQLTKVEWLEQQTRAAYRRVHFSPDNEKFQAILEVSLGCCRGLPHVSRGLMRVCGVRTGEVSCAACGV